MFRTRTLLSIAAAAALGLNGVAFADHEPGHSALSPQEVARILNDAKGTMADSIAAAEKHCGGKAIVAHVCTRGEALSKAGSEITDSTAKGANTDAVFVVIMLVGDNKLVEATVDPRNQQVLAKRTLDKLEPPGAAAVASRINDFAMPRTFQKSSDLIEKNVVDMSGEKLGEIEDLVVDPNSGRVLYGILSFGGIAGIGEKLFAVPYGALKFPNDAKHYQLDVDKGTLKNLSGFDKKNWPNFADETLGAAAYNVYKIKPYWEGRTEVPRAVLSDRMVIEYRERWFKKPVTWQKASDLTAKEVHGPQHEEIGKMSDLAVEPMSGRILYGVIASGGKYYAVPWNAVKLPDDAKYFMVNFNKDQLKEEASFTKDKWPNLVDPIRARELHDTFKVRPYWFGPGEVAGEPQGALDNYRDRDNTGINARDRDPNAKTAGVAGQSKSDVELAAAIRRKVVDQNLSVNAQNVKIIAQNGKVTLRGPVKTTQEKDTVARIATEIAGNDNIDNQLEVQIRD